MARYRFAHAQGAQPKCLEDAGIRMPNCRAVVILTVDDGVNLRIAIMARLCFFALESYKTVYVAS